MEELSTEEMTALRGGSFRINVNFSRNFNGDDLGNGIANKSGGIANHSGGVADSFNNQNGVFVALGS
jgi:hypothetical protein